MGIKGAKMKKTLLSISILLLFTGCNGDMRNSFIPNSTQTEPKLFSQEVEEGKGGNPEVYIAHNCLKGKLAKTCLEKLFSDERKSYIQSYEIIKLAGRGASVEKATIEFEDDDLFLLYLDTSNVDTPLSINIKGEENASDSHSVLFILPVKEIDKEIIVKDKKGNIVLQYKVLRKE